MQINLLNTNFLHRVIHLDLIVHFTVQIAGHILTQVVTSQQGHVNVVQGILDHCVIKCAQQENGVSAALKFAGWFCV